MSRTADVEWLHNERSKLISETNQLRAQLATVIVERDALASCNAGLKTAEDGWHRARDHVAGLLSEVQAKLATVTADRDRSADAEGRLRLLLAAEEGAHMDTKRRAAAARSEGWRDGRDAAVGELRRISEHAHSVHCENLGHKAADQLASLTETKGEEPPVEAAALPERKG